MKKEIAFKYSLNQYPKAASSFLTLAIYDWLAPLRRALFFEILFLCHATARSRRLSSWPATICCLPQPTCCERSPNWQNLRKWLSLTQRIASGTT